CTHMRGGSYKPKVRQFDVGDFVYLFHTFLKIKMIRPLGVLELQRVDVCWKTKDVDQMLLCDNCNGGYHLLCPKPELIQVPVNIWYCSSCSPASL
ncbi:hypothetical protein BDL97_11G045500, partial [Sphagnum fallax]